MPDETNGGDKPEHELSEEQQQLVDEATVKKAEADARKAVAEADKAETDARTAQVASFVPDLSKVTPSVLDVKEQTPPVGGTVLAYRALDAAAAALVGRLPDLKGKRVLVTSDSDLATPDATYHDVSTGLDYLKDAADKLLGLEDGKRLDAMGVAAAPLFEALAIAVPPALSLLSARRSLSGGAVTVSDMAAIAAVTGALIEKGVNVVHGEFQLISHEAAIYKSEDCLREKRQALIDKKVDLSTKKNPDDATRISLIETLVSAIDAFETAVRAVPEGAKRSALASAALQGELYEEDEQNRCSHVLLIKSQSGQSLMLLNDAPLWLSDKVSTLADVTVSYMLYVVGEGGIKASGNITKSAQAWGKLGDKLTIDALEPN